VVVRGGVGPSEGPGPTQEALKIVPFLGLKSWMMEVTRSCWELVWFQFKQELLAGHAQDTVTLKLLPPTIQQPAAAFREVFTEVFKSAQILWPHLDRVLHFQGVQAAVSINDEIHLYFRPSLTRAEQVREGKWTQTVAVGSRDFAETMKAKLGIRAKGRRICGMDGESCICEPQAS
jgi:hypothetical protein